MKKFAQLSEEEGWSSTSFNHCLIFDKIGVDLSEASSTLTRLTRVGLFSPRTICMFRQKFSPKASGLFLSVPLLFLCGLLRWHALRATAEESSCLLGMNCLAEFNTLQLYTLYTRVTIACLSNFIPCAYTRLPPTVAWHLTTVRTLYNFTQMSRLAAACANVFIVNHHDVVSLKVIWLSCVTGRSTGG